MLLSLIIQIYSKVLFVSPGNEMENFPCFLAILRCYRRLLNISYKDHVTNEEVRRKIQAAIGEYDELLTLVKKRKLRWFGHVSRSYGLAKTILQGTVKGKRKRGRQKKRWEDNIKEWTGMDFASSTRAAENRSRWKGVVANSSVVPRRPSKVMG